MSILSLAGNVISTTPFWGHWQLVNLDGSSQTEFEVQTPWIVAFGLSTDILCVSHQWPVGGIEPFAAQRMN